MHLSSILRVRWFVGTYLNDSEHYSILDVGSYDVNGTYRQCFDSPKFSYTGLDMAEGPNVDIVPANPYCWREIADKSFDVIVSGQALEHIEFFWITLQEIARVLKPGGMLCIVAPRGFGRHRYPIDCYRFDADGMVALAKFINFVPLHASTNLAPIGASKDWYSTEQADSLLVARKPENWSGILDVGSYVFQAHDLESLESGFAPSPPDTDPPISSEALEQLQSTLSGHERRLWELERLSQKPFFSKLWRSLKIKRK